MRTTAAMLSAPYTHVAHLRARPKVLVPESMMSLMRALAFTSLASRSSPTSFMISGPTRPYHWSANE